MKTIAIAVMLLASSAFGAVTVTAPQTVAAVGGVAEIPLSVATDIPLGAIGIYLNCDKPGALMVTGQVGHDPAMGEKVTSDPTTLGFIASGDPSDFGNFTGSYGLLAPGAAGTTRQGDFTTLTLAVTPGIDYPITLNLIGDWASSLNTGAQSDLWAMTSVVITPEPASMLLLAAGAAFFARRRRA